MERRVLRTSLLCVFGFTAVSLFALRDATLAQTWQDVPSFRGRLLPLVYAPTSAVVSEERGTSAALSIPASTPRGHPHRPPPPPLPSSDHDLLDSMDAAELPPSPSFHLPESLPPIVPLPSTFVAVPKPPRPPPPPQRPPPPPQRPHHLRLTTDDWPVPATLDPNERYITYLAHSGFHNQRIAFVNALVLGQILNRTLLVPAVTLGDAVAWAATPSLQRDVEKAEHSDLQACRDILDPDVRRHECGAAWNSRRASWSWILGAKTFAASQRLINRPTVDRSWFQTALNILPSEIKSFPDLDRRSYRICDTSGPACDLGPEGTVFQTLIEMEEIERYDEYKLLEFGGLYGGGRLTLRSERNKAIKKWADKQMAFKEVLLNEISNTVAERLGGRNKYVGLHLRVGGSGDKFKNVAVERTARVFVLLLTKVYGLDPPTAESLLLSNRAGISQRPIPLLPIPLDPSEVAHPSPHLACPSVLYPPNSPLATLNTPLFVATDSFDPRDDRVLDLFHNTFPCIFFLSDFLTINTLNLKRVEELDYLESVVDDEDERLGPFLEPFVDAEVIAKGRSVVGTPGSTFSAFAKTILYGYYRNNR